MVCGSRDTCVSCSETDSCAAGYVCRGGRCAPCSPDFEGCPCDDGQCGEGLVCHDATVCEAPACGDGILNGDEIDVDCGGSCEPCAEGSSCVSGEDCESLSCNQGTCLAIGSCVVPTDEFPTIQSAADEARCVKILLEEGLFEESVRVDRALEIDGVLRGTVLSSVRPGPAVEITEGAGTVRLRHLEFRGNSAVRGAGVLSRRDLVIEDSAFTGNRANQTAVSEDGELHPCGGAVFVEDANLTVRNTTFVENEAEEVRLTGLRIDVAAYGGAVCVVGEREALIESSAFDRKPGSDDDRHSRWLSAPGRRSRHERSTWRRDLSIRRPHCGPRLDLHG